MASVRRQKVALRAALFAYLAGAHYVIEEVEKAQALSPGGQGADATELRHAMLEADYERLVEQPQNLEMLSEILDEEDLYPFGSEWPREALMELAALIIPPKLSITEPESSMKFRFKRGFKKMVLEFASAIEGVRKQRSSLDHWLVLLLNTAFHAGAVIAARSAENPKAYYDVIPSIEEETEPWTKYPQLGDMLDRQLRVETRRRSGLVSDLDY